VKEVLDRQDELQLKELELCQMHVEVSSQRIWQSGALLLAGALAALGFALQISANEEAAAWITTLLAGGAVIILAIWIWLVRRERGLAHASIERMRSLEEQLQMSRQDLIAKADAKGWVDTTLALQMIGILAMMGWVAVAAWRWLIYLEYSIRR
jgi:hypothetical protein